MRTAIYVRVSTQEQAEEGYSIKAQIERLNAYASSQDWKVVKTYVDDGQSAKDMKRTELSRMLDDMKNDNFDCVLVYKLDRLTRSVLDLYTMLNVFEKYNVKFKSATEVYDTTNAMGRLFITLVAALAQWERENLGERVRMGMNQKAKEGKWTVSLPPFGFNKNGDNLEINEKEAAIVREIFELYLTGKYGVGKIAKLLNYRGTKTKNNANWNLNSIRYVLTNMIYIGTMRYNYRVNKDQYFEVENVVSPIIEENDFKEVQRIMSSRAKKHPRKATSPYIFTSVLKCARCGSYMYGKQTSGKARRGYITYSYYCVGRRNGTCNLPSISQNYLEAQFLELINNWNYRELIKDVNILPHATHNEDKEKMLKKELSEIEQRRSKWQYAWMQNLISDDDLKNRKNEEDANEKRIKQELLAIEQHLKFDETEEKIASSLQKLRDNWSFLEIYEKKKLVEMLIKKMDVDKKMNIRKPESVEISNMEFL